MIRFPWALTFALLFVATVRADYTLHVAPDGRDDQPGTLTQPLQSLVGARDRVRDLRGNGERGTVTVEFSPGRYVFGEAVQFAKQDSGTADAEVVYKANSPGEVRFSGGQLIDRWKRVTAADDLARLAEQARGHVQVADLQVEGITDFGKLTIHGFAMSSRPAEAELFFDDMASGPYR